MLNNGGRFVNYFSRHTVTHIVCSNLPDSKMKNLRYVREEGLSVATITLSGSTMVIMLLFDPEHSAEDFLLLSQHGWWIPWQRTGSSTVFSLVLTHLCVDSVQNGLLPSCTFVSLVMPTDV